MRLNRTRPGRSHGAEPRSGRACHMTGVTLVRAGGLLTRPAEGSIPSTSTVSCFLFAAKRSTISRV
jgi:hypothetical protein